MKSTPGGFLYFSGFGLAVLAGLLYSFCFTFMQLMELCTDKEHNDVKGNINHPVLFSKVVLLQPLIIHLAFSLESS